MATSSTNDRDGVGDVSEAQSTLEQADAFLRQNGANLHPALSTQSGTASGQAAVETTPAFGGRTIELYTEEFKQAIEDYQNLAEDPRIKALNIRGHQSWEEVIQKAKDAEAKYLAAGSGRMKRLGRAVTDRSAAFLPLVRLIPNDSFCSVISGGLRLVVELSASKISEKKEEVLRSLLRIPYVIVQADECCENFGPDPILLAKAEIVYLAALVAIEGTTKWLSSGSSRKQGRALLRGPLYSKPFDDKMKHLDDSLTDLQAYVSGLRDRVLNQTKNGVDSLTQLHGETQAGLTQVRRLQQASKDAIEEMKKVLADTNSTAKWMRQKDKDICHLKTRIKELEQAAVALTQEDLLEILDVGRDLPLFDLRKVLRADPDLSDSQMALSISSGSRFKEWQSQDISVTQTLFIETQTSTVSTRHVSAVTLVSLHFIRSLQDQPEVTVIYFFCSQHTSSKDATQGPKGLMRSLISQLLYLCQVKLDFISLRLRQQLENLDFRGLCECFSRLLKRLPPTTVLFCIVDSINYFERRDWLDETTHIINLFQDLVYESDLDATFLLLMTSPTRTRHISGMFPPEARLSIKGEDATGTRSQMTERQLAEASRRPQRANNVFSTSRSQKTAGMTSDNGLEEEPYSDDAWSS